MQGFMTQAGQEFGKVNERLDGIDERLNGIDGRLDGMQEDIRNIISHLDSIEKRLEISEDERLVMSHQLERLHAWVEKAGERIGLKFEH